MIRKGKFRSDLDLFYRLNIIHLEILPLRECKSDIPALIMHFLDIFNLGNKDHVKISSECTTMFCKYGWSDNIRKLRNIVEKLVIETEGQVVASGDLSQYILDNVNTSIPHRLQEVGLLTRLERVEAEEIRRVL